jgi:hypothetical protein
MGFFPCKAEPDIWMRHVDDHYEYIAMYVDDLAISSKDPKAITDNLMNKYNFKLKGTGEIEYHLGMSFCRNDRNKLCISPQRYIEKMVENYKHLVNPLCIVHNHLWNQMIIQKLTPLSFSVKMTFRSISL